MDNLTRIQAVNSMVCSNAAMLAWRASKPDRLLYGLFQSMLPNNSCSRSSAAGKLEVPEPNTRNLALWNMATTWNAIPDLRIAKSEWKANQIVKKFAKSFPSSLLKCLVKFIKIVIDYLCKSVPSRTDLCLITCSKLRVEIHLI